MKTALAAVIAVWSAIPAVAQVSGKAVGTFTPPSCGEPGKELERASFALAIPKASAPIKLVYAGCRDEGRNDYLSGYTERDYKGADGYGLTLVTRHGDGAYPAAHEEDSSEVLVSKGKDWIARVRAVENAQLVSGEAVEAGKLSVSAIKAEPPQVKACEGKLPKPVYGPNELWLLTKTTAYYYREDCDICAELDSCDLATGKVKEEINAHMIECSEVAPFKKGAEIVYDRCAQ